MAKASQAALDKVNQTIMEIMQQICTNDKSASTNNLFKTSWSIPRKVILVSRKKTSRVISRLSEKRKLMERSVYCSRKCHFWVSKRPMD